MIGLPGFALAAPAEGEVFTETDYYAEPPVVLSVSKLAQSQAWAPGAATVIERAMIDASDFRTIPDLLRLVPGIQVVWAVGEYNATRYFG